MKSVSKNTILKLLKSKKTILLLLLAAAGILLAVISSNSSKSDVEAVGGIESLDPSSYAEGLERRIEELCNRVDGVSGTYAVVTLKSGYQANYATDFQAGASVSKNQTVLIGSGRDEQAILEGYSYPEIAGVGIVCRGGDSYAVKNKIISLISSTFDISSNKIFVVGS